jgi:cytochrome c-type biogenesis protein CcmF
VESARNASIVVFPFLSLSVASVIYSLYVMDFSQAYVYDVASTAMSTFLRLTALWGGQQGSVLFWAWIMSGFVAVVLIRKWDRDRELMPYVIAVAMLTTTFFIGITVFITNPFQKLWIVPGAQNLMTSALPPAGAEQYIPQDGQGLNPLLRHFGMIGHPPTTYIGFTGLVIPYAFAIAALFTGKSSGDEWIRTTRRWTLVAWIFLSIGIILGGRWAYDVLGWGGFWAWDPVENAMFMPWLTATAFLHSVMMTEKRGMLKKWNMILIILTYALAVFGTFITRTGVITSVHSFSKSALGPAFFVYITLTLVGSLALLAWRWNTLKTEHHLESIFSRETAFVLQNMLFLAIAFAVFWGTVFPLVSELATNTKITVGPAYFKKVTGPLFFAIVLLMGVAPLMAWRKQIIKSLGRAILVPFTFSAAATVVWGYLHRMHPVSIAGLWLVSFTAAAVVFEYAKGIRARMISRKEFIWTAAARLIGRNHRRYGGYLIHLSVIMIALGVIGDSFYKSETQGTLSAGQRLSIGQYTMQFNGLKKYPGTDGREVYDASTSLFQGNNLIHQLNPRRDFFIVQEQPVSVPAVHSTAGEDVYILLVGWNDSGTEATFKVFVNPLINWVWLGGIAMMLGTLVAAWTRQDGGKEATYSFKQALPDPLGGD